jgi:hypothetical protein
MARKKKSEHPLDVFRELLTEDEFHYAEKLFDTYKAQLAYDCNLDSKLLKRFNYMGLYQYGLRDKVNPTIQKLKKVQHLYASHIIVAHGFITAQL